MRSGYTVTCGRTSACGGKLYKHLRRRGKKRNSRGSGYSGRGHIPGRVDITERPQIVEDKRRVGDWEADTIVGAGHRGALVSVVDRASKFTVLHPVSSRSAGEVGEAMMERLMPYVEIVHTITSDNGKEFAGHGEITEALGAGFFFATPYHSWERGLNEHTNGLVRAVLCEGDLDFREVRGDEVRRVEAAAQREASEGSGVPDAGGGFQRGLGPRGLIRKNRERAGRRGVRGRHGVCLRSGYALPSASAIQMS